MILIDKIEGKIGGKPAVAGTRISVEIILAFIAEGQSVDDILESYPHLDRKVVEGVIEVGLISRKVLDAVDPEEASRRTFGKKIHLDFDY